MSLLIKALDKAQAEKVQAKDKAAKKSAAKKAKSEKSSKHLKREKNKAASAPITLVEEDLPLSLGASEEKSTSNQKAASNDILAADLGKKEALVKPNISASPAVSPSPKRLDNTARIATPAQAAAVFTANGADAKAQNAKLAFAAVTGLILILALWLAYYLLADNTPEVVIPPRPLATQEMPAPLPSTVLPEVAEINLAEEIEPALEEEIVVLDASTSEVKEILIEKMDALAQGQDDEAVMGVERTLKSNEMLASANTSTIIKRTGSSSQMSSAIASESASIKVTQKKQTAGVDPVLMRAYEAYRAGNDSEAQQGYKQVLRRYRTNVDAMLGLGAIATRQGRLADANDWYLKVLAVEPRNSIAQAAMLDSQQKNGAQANESQIKSMITSDPDNANLHATLGGLYAEQSQWPAAQQAYFDAYRLNANVDNAFNLGISLDQMGKSKLALPYYQEALSKAGQSSAIDAAGLEARIASIQQAMTN